MTEDNDDPTLAEFGGKKIHQSQAKYGIAAMVCAALIPSGGIVALWDVLDIGGANALKAQIVELREDKAAIRARSDAALVAAGDQCKAQMAPLVANVNSLRGQNCEHMRQLGLEIENCWGLER